MFWIVIVSCVSQSRATLLFLAFHNLLYTNLFSGGYRNVTLDEYGLSLMIQLYRSQYFLDFSSATWPPHVQLLSIFSFTYPRFTDVHNLVFFFINATRQTCEPPEEVGSLNLVECKVRLKIGPSHFQLCFLNLWSINPTKWSNTLTVQKHIL